MTQTEALRLALEALKSTGENNGYHGVTQYFDETMVDQAITAIKAALEAKDEKANDELRRLHDLLGKANALARIRANKIDELEQRLTKTEAQLGEAVWNYGELKREQLANQQKTSGSPINTSTALEAKDEPVAWSHAGAMPPEQEEMKEAAYRLAPWLSAALDDPKVCQEYKNDINAWFDAAMPAPQRTWVGLTNEEVWECYTSQGSVFYQAIEAKLKEKNT